MIKRDLGKVQALCDHLGTYQHGALRCVERLEQLFVRILALGGVRVHADDVHMRGHDLSKGVFNLLRTQPHLREISTAALGAGRAGRGVRVDVVDGAARMALKRVSALMIG